jgi:stalled ribosome rescue protein Dom34
MRQQTDSIHAMFAESRFRVEAIARVVAKRDDEEIRMTDIHAIVWLDHREARIASFSLGSSHLIEVHSHSSERRIHRKAREIGSGKAADDHHFFDEIVAALVDIRQVLIAGPGNAKTAFETYITSRHVDLAKRVVGVETLDHPTDGELLAHARKSFKAIDQLGLDNDPGTTK